jgi:3-phosphoshikimate 1-carboxyvinyltransferase
MAGLLAGKGVKAKFTGDKSLSERPMNRIIEPLKKMGISIESENGYLPLLLTPGNINGIIYTPQAASAQVKSCIILAGLGAFGETKVQEKIKTRDHTEIMLRELGAEIKSEDVISIQPLKKPLVEFEITIPGDPSSAAFFAAATAMIPNSDLTITKVLANPTRIGFFSVLEDMGADIEWDNMRKEGGEWVGDVHIFCQQLNGLHIMKDLIPTVIDEIPIIAVLATQADSPTVIEGAAELRVKESDRIKAICQNLQSMGAEIIEKKDGFIINPINKLHHTNIETFGDHRIAMAFTIAGLLPLEKNTLDDENCINISFPEFSDILSQICQ